METCYEVFARERIQSIPIEEDRFGFEPAITSMYGRENLDQELATLRTLIRELDQELPMIELAVAGPGASTENHVPA